MDDFPLLRGRLRRRLVEVSSGHRSVGSNVALGKTVHSLTARRVNVVHEGITLGVVRHGDAL